MNHRKVLSRNATWLAGTVALLGSWSCSLLYDFNTSQCNETQDCKNQGPQFEHAKCVNHVCVQTNASDTGGATSSGGSGTSGNSSDTGGSSALGGSTSGAASSVGGSTANGGTRSSGGSTAVNTGTSVGGVSSGGTSSTSNATSVGGSSLIGGQTGVGGVGGIGGVTQLGGTSAIGGSTGTGGAQTTGGTVGTTAPECSTNFDCVHVHSDQPYICRSGSCIPLASTNCPVLIPALTWLNLLKDTSKSPIIIGGFANMDTASDPHSTGAIVNWDLAFDEFNTRTISGGLPGYPAGGPARPFLGVICQGKPNIANLPKDVTGSMKHLTQDIGVSSILTTLTATDLYNAWQTTSTAQNVFFMNTGSANTQLVTTDNGGMLWHMLGDAHVLAASIVALVHQMEPYIYQQRKANFAINDVDDPDSVPLRVTMVYSTHPTMLDMHDVLTNTTDTKHPESQLSFNNKSLTDNGSNYREVKIDSILVTNPPTVTAAISELESNPPHLVLALTTSEFPASVMQPVETTWGTTGSSNPSYKMIRPYYLMSHLTYNAVDLLSRTKASYALGATPFLHQRVVGVNYAEAQDARSKGLYNAYYSRLQGANPTTTLALSGTENYYDGAYYLLYSIAAAGAKSTAPSSVAIWNAFLQRVINTTNGESVNVDPGVIGTTVGYLYGGAPYYMALWGTMGYPNFDTLLGTRISQTSAWCVQQTSGSTTGTYQPDGLIYDALSRTYSPNSAGIPACLQSYCPPDADAGVNTCPESY